MPGSWSWTRCPDRSYVYPPYLHSQLLSLTAQMPRHVCVHVFEHRRNAGGLPGKQRAVTFGFLLRGDDLGLVLLLRRVMLFFRPVAKTNQMLLEAFDRVSQRKARPVVGRAVLGGIVGRGVRAGTITDPFNERGAQVVAGAIDGPAGNGHDGQEVVAIGTHRHNTAAQTAGREGGALAPGYRLERGNGPLIVDDVQHYRRLVDMRERERCLEVGRCRGAVADPGRGNAGVALDGRGHGPA